MSCDLDVPQGSVLGPLLLVSYVSLVSDIVTSAGFGFNQHADDTDLFRHAVRQVNQNLNAMRICTEHLRYWFYSNDLMLKPDNSEDLIVSTHQQRNAVATVQSVPVAGADLPIMSELKSLLHGCDH